MKVAVLILAILIAAATCFARAVKVWSLVELDAAADTIALLQAVSTEKIDLPAPKDFPESADNYQAWVTTFKVHSVFKGNTGLEKALKVVHFGYSEKKNVILNGACFIHFTVGPVHRRVSMKYDGGGHGSFEEMKYFPVWLAYLRKRADGTFEPAIGQYDAAPAFREVSEHRVH